MVGEGLGWGGGGGGRPGLVDCVGWGVVVEGLDEGEGEAVVLVGG